jgi:hypothetical protein
MSPVVGSQDVAMTEAAESQLYSQGKLTAGMPRRENKII